MANTKHKANVPCDDVQGEIKMCTRCGVNPRRTQQSANATWCKECTSQYAKDKRAADFAAGICMRCSNPRREDNVLCQACASKEYSRRKKLRDNTKQQIVEYLGGACVDCGLVTEYVDAYDCHHIDPTLKDVEIGDKLSRQMTFEQLKPELTNASSSARRATESDIRNKEKTRRPTNMGIGALRRHRNRHEIVPPTSTESQPVTPSVTPEKLAELRENPAFEAAYQEELRLAEEAEQGKQ